MTPPARSASGTRTGTRRGSSAGPPVVFLGPQRFDPTLAATVKSLGITGELATVTAGWQEREDDDAELRDHLDARGINLLLHRRGDEVFARDRELGAAHHLKQEALQELQGLYRVRLSHAREAARRMFTAEADSTVKSPEQEDAIAGLRALDDHHTARVREIQARFDEQWRPHQRVSVARHRDELARLLEPCAGLTIAGGHVAVLLNRLQLFGVAELIAGKPVIAWSAGAMALTERIVLFHDSPPQGAGAPEILAPGLGLIPGVVALPHARTRLKLEHETHVGLFARRFAPAASVVLDKASRLDWNGRSLRPGPATSMLTGEGTVVEMAPAPGAAGGTRTRGRP